MEQITNFADPAYRSASRRRRGCEVYGPATTARVLREYDNPQAWVLAIVVLTFGPKWQPSPTRVESLGRKPSGMLHGHLSENSLMVNSCSREWHTRHPSHYHITLHATCLSRRVQVTWISYNDQITHTLEVEVFVVAPARYTPM